MTKIQLQLSLLVLLTSPIAVLSFGFGISQNSRISSKHIKISKLASIGYLSDFYDYYENNDDKFHDGENSEGEDEEDEDMLEETVLDYGEESADMEETVVLKPVPDSPNYLKGAKYIAVIIDSELDTLDRTKEELFSFRQKFSTIKNHVRWAREANLVNETIHETWKEDTKVDIPFSYSVLSSDLLSEIGSIICLNAQSPDDVLSYLAKEPIVQNLFGFDSESSENSSIKNNQNDIIKALKKANILYKWRHSSDEVKLRQDDGRFGLPNAMIAMDASRSGTLRQSHSREHYEYLIKSERVIACGPLLPLDHDSGSKSDGIDSVTGEGIGDLVFFNAPSREDAVSFVEEDPLALHGVYDSLRVYRFNTVDVTGKHVAMDKYASSCTDVIFNEMEEEGYAVYDYQTPWVR